MSCPTCDHTMQRIGKDEIGDNAGVFWCPRCGTLKADGWYESPVPKLVERAASLSGKKDKKRKSTPEDNSKRSKKNALL